MQDKIINDYLAKYRDKEGWLPLEKAMKKFEEGVKLTRGCQAALKEAEQKVEILLKSAGGEEQLEAFEIDEEDE